MKRSYSKKSSDSKHIKAIFPIFIIVCFWASIFGASYFSDLGQTLNCMIMVGIGCVSIGMFIAFIVKQKIGLIFLLLGILTECGVLVYKYGTEEMIIKLSEEVIPVACMSVFVIFGMVVIIMPHLKGKRNKNKCTFDVVAKCEEIKKYYDFDESTELYSPVWNYYLDGKQYTYCDNFYSPSSSVNIGDIRVLKVNSKNPEEVYSETDKTGYLVLTIIGTIFVFMGIVGIWFIFQQI